jgi:hypothetical protein
MKIGILFITFIFITSFLYGEMANAYDRVLIKTIQIGSKDGQLMYDKNALPGKPFTFTISKKNIIYVCDTLKWRISLFDLSLNFIKNINYFFKEDNIAFVPDTIKINDNDDIILFSNLHGFIKIDNSGVKKYYIDIRNQDHNIGNLNNFFAIDDYVFYYDDKENLIVIDKAGTIKDVEFVKEIIKSYSVASASILNTADSQKFNDFAEKNKLLIHNNELFTAEYQKYIKINKFKKANSLQAKGVTMKNNINLDTVNLETLLGADINQNQYWRGALKENWKSTLITVFSKDGEVIDCFLIPQNMFTTVAPNGDIYLMQSLGTGISFYKITRSYPSFSVTRGRHFF